MPLPNSRKPCPICSQPMSRQSLRCRSCWLADHVRPDSYQTVTCGKCQESFTVHKAQIERGQGRYCSRICARSGSPTRKRALPGLTCQTCNRPVWKPPYVKARNRTGLVFCSRGCSNSYFTRENHYLWAGGQEGRMSPEGRTWRRLVLKRDRKRCRLCQSRKDLEAHHIRPYAQFVELRWEVSNGIMLCSCCHLLIYGKEMEFVDLLSTLAAVPVAD